MAPRGDLMVLEKSQVVPNGKGCEAVGPLAGSIKQEGPKLRKLFLVVLYFLFDKYV